MSMRVEEVMVGEAVEEALLEKEEEVEVEEVVNKWVKEAEETSEEVEGEESLFPSLCLSLALLALRPPL
ncbi:hypothetical protein GDO78_019181 [Eleutherodactylus coqui]|uniref:Uncharacterized protein n=1 Tax=Eleutherodactylus coqui TaxID=57060 RepID=A0A8J6BD71_ELECQ|nr:hypothetical protein GDO78_019181 [Eleutherodactylus coqui]